MLHEKFKILRRGIGLRQDAKKHRQHDRDAIDHDLTNAFDRRKVGHENSDMVWKADRPDFHLPFVDGQLHEEQLAVATLHDLPRPEASGRRDDRVGIEVHSKGGKKRLQVLRK